MHLYTSLIHVYILVIHAYYKLQLFQHLLFLNMHETLTKEFTISLRALFNGRQGKAYFVQQMLTKQKAKSSKASLTVDI